MATQIQLRRDTASNWTSNNPTLAAGEFGWESDTNRFKIGTGSLAWNSLGYASEGDTAGITFVGDDSTGTTVNQNETFKIAGTQNITAVVSGDTLTLTGPDLSSYLTSVSESDVTQHQAALSITESQISDLQNYKTSVSESDVTQHQAALSITESQISDLNHFSGAYADLTGKPTIPTNNTELTNGAGYITASSTDTLTNKSGNVSQFTNDSGYKTSVSESDVTQHQSALSITESQITDLNHFSGSYTDLTNKPTIPTNNTELTNGAGYITASSTDTLTNKSGNISQFTNDAGYKTSVSQSDVTQHQSALSITESQISDLSHFSGSYTDLTNKPTIPTNNNELTNGAGYITDANITIVGDDSTGTSFSAKDNDNIKITGTQNTAVSVSGDTITVTGPDLSSYASTSYVDTAIANTVDSAPETLNTLNELAAALGDDANFATTTSTALGNRLRVDTAAQGLTSTQKSNAKTNLGLATVASTGAYSDLTGTPTIPTNNNQLTNGAGYITGYSVTEGDVTQHQAALSITESQISDLAHFSGSYTDLTNKPTIPTNNTELTNGAGYITASSTDTLTNKSGNVSQFTNDSGYKTSVSQSDVTQHQAALSITESQVSDLGSYITASSTDTLTNKTFNANGTGNSISNLEVADFATGIVDTDFTSVSAADNTLASAKAIKNYVDTQDGNIASDTLTFTNKSGNISQWTNDSNYLTSVSESDVTAHQAALSITESQISDLGSYITASSTDTLTNKSGNISQWTNDSGYSTFSGSYTDLTNKPTIPTNNNQLTNGAGYLTSVAFADVTSKPTTIAGYGITDAFDGAYSSLSGKPTIPSALTDLSITDGSNGQVLTTDGAGNFTFTTVSGGSASTGDITFTGSTISAPSNADLTLQPGGTGKVVIDGFNFPTTDGSNGQVLTTDGAGNLSFTTVSGGAASTGDFTFTGNEMSTSSSNADMELGTSGTGAIVLKANGGSTSNLIFTSSNRYDNANMLYHEDLSHTAGSRRVYGNTAQLNIKLDGTDTTSGNARFYAMSSFNSLDLNGTDSTNSSGGRGPNGMFAGNDVTNSSATAANLGNMSCYGSYNYLYDYSGTSGGINVTNAAGFRTSMFEADGITATATNAYGVFASSPVAYSGGNGTVTNSYGFYYSHSPGSLTFTNDPYLLYTNDDSVRSNPGAINKFNEYSYNATHSSGSAYNIDWNNGNLQTVTLTSNITGFTMSNFPTSTKQSVGVTLYLVQDGTGSRTMTFTAASGETFKFANGSNSSSVSSANDIQVCYIFSRYNGSSNTFYWTIGPAFS